MAETTFDPLLQSAVDAHRAGRLADAAALYRQVLIRSPTHALAWHQLGTLAMQTARYEEAFDLLVRAIQFDGAKATYHHNLGACCRMLGRLDQARASYEQALRFDPDNVVTRAHLALVLYAGQDREQADRFALDVLRRERTTPEAHGMCGMLQVLRGELPQGFVEQEWRLAAQPPRQPLDPTIRWNGGELAGRGILIHAEQGLGDTLQYVRFVDAVRQRGGRPTLAVQPQLLPLLRQSGFDECLSIGEPWPARDAHVALLSLPAVLETTLATIPGEPYLKADESRRTIWRERLSGDDRMRVGICWQGSPSYPFDRTRSAPLRVFAPMAAMDRVRLVSLQKGPGHEQLRHVEFGSAITDLSDELDIGGGAFLDTAAVMCNLDLVITSDTSIAHLAGGLGVPVWTLLSTMADVRWMLDRPDTPWYPSMRLWRQLRIGDWDEVIARVAAELRASTAKSPRS